MGWFGDQVKQREENDNSNVEHAFHKLSSVVMGKNKVWNSVNENLRTKNAVEEICKYYRAAFSDAPEDVTDINEQLEYMLRPSGIMRRRVKLTGRWWKDCIGPLLGETKQGDVVALLPEAMGGYRFYDYHAQKILKINHETAELLEEEAICFYKPLPREAIGVPDLIKFLAMHIARADIAALGLTALLATLFGLFIPVVNRIVFENVIPSGRTVLLLTACVPLFGVAVSVFLLNVAKTLMQTKIETKLDTALQGAVMGRLVNLPPQFFKEYSAGELAGRLRALDVLGVFLCEALLGTGFSALFSLIYIVQIVVMAPSLALPALIVTFVQLALIAIGVLYQTREQQMQMLAGTKVEGVVFSLYSGIQKIKLGGCEKRAFAKWAAAYEGQASAAYASPFFLKIQNTLIGASALAGTMLIYYSAASSDVSVPQFMAFGAALGMVSGAIVSLSNISPMLSYIRPVLDLVKPMRALSGAVEVNNVSFRYKDGEPLILDNLSLKIRRGQYIAIVGKTGCGKSTLLRLLLGFEQPHKGSVYYDGEDLAKIDLKSLRSNIGVVMQNGKLFAGDIYSNITISAPWLSLNEAWEAAEMAGIAQDIRDMPMGMHTMLSEGAGGISGGQKQRLMIARAIAAKPKILMFDEATSALDNITQRQVSDSLAGLKCTRIVIAHRLSTIRQCDRVIVLDGGKIVEDGTYEELMENGGFFAELVKRQRIGDEAV